MKYRIITISRQYGSGGRIIGKLVAQKLGIKFYDNEIIDLAAKDLGMELSTIRKIAEKKSSPFMYSISSTNFELPLNDQVFTAQSKIIRHLAKEESCVIVSCCADYILNDFKDVIKVYIHAPLDSRIQRVIHTYEERATDFEKYIKHKDKNRARYYNYYTDQKWGKATNFDLTMNSDLGIELIVEQIVQVYNQKSKY